MNDFSGGRLVAINGYELHVEEHGAGEPLLLVVTRGFADGPRIAYQNRPRLFDRRIVLPESADDRVLIAAGLISAEGLARQKTPEHVAIVAELPKTPAGKVRKDVLRVRAAEFGKV